MESKNNSTTLKSDKLCGVCGDKALGQNFNAMTCESCKAFFRRNALRNKPFKCPFNDNCEVNVVTRRFCQKCRLKKCFDIGMKKDLILSQEEKLQKRMKIESNRAAKKRLQEETGTQIRPQARVAPSTRPATQEETTTPKICKLDEEECVVHSLPGQSNVPLSSSSVKPNQQQQLITQKNCENCTEKTPSYTQSSSSSSFEFNVDQQLDAIVAIAIEAEFNSNSLDKNNPNLMSLTVTSSNKYKLNHKEMERLHELSLASQFLDEPLDPDTSNPSDLIGVIHLTDLATKRIIKMTKHISPFSKLCQDDQIALLKGGCSELMILKSVRNFDPDKNSWRLPTGKDRSQHLMCDMDVLKEASQLGVNLYEEHQKFIKSFDPKWRNDEYITLLLSAIALFTPERANVIHKNVVKLEQDTYYYLLRRYLESVYDGCESRSVYLSLIGLIGRLHRLNETHIQVYLEVNPRFIAPLLIEIFDLKPTPISITNGPLQNI